MSDHLELAAYILKLEGLDPWNSTDDQETIETSLMDIVWD